MVGSRSSIHITTYPHKSLKFRSQTLAAIWKLWSVVAGQGETKPMRREHGTTTRIRKASRYSKIFQISPKIRDWNFRSIKQHQALSNGGTFDQWQQMASSNIQWLCQSLLQCSRPWREAGAWKPSGRSSSLRSYREDVGCKGASNFKIWRHWSGPKGPNSPTNPILVPAKVE